MKRTLALTLLALAAAACSDSSPQPGPARPAELTHVDLPNHPSLTPLPDPEQNGGHTGRAPRRLTVAQLRESIATVTAGTRQWSQLNTLAASLGQADFALTNAESTEANLVFAKFLEDGAREVCLNVARDDLNRAQDARILWPELPGTGRDFTLVDDGTVQKNLATLSVRFWGSPFNADELAVWTQDFKGFAANAKRANRPEQAWGAVCIAMMTDPRFFTY
ncbi:MAG: hypothetical protein IT380_17440 [Myxococcales bacterium]|nr:hypothetical protein [Myxococcales bacterium]